MPREKKLIQDTFLYAIANFGSSLLTFAMLPLYTHYFSPEAFGIWDIAMTTETLLIPFISFELTTATYRWLLNTTKQEDRIQIISSGFFQIIWHMFAANCVLLVLFLSISVPYKWPALLMLNVMIISSFLQQCARGIGRNKLFAGMGLLQTSLVITLNLLFILYYKLGIEAFFYANSIAGILTITLAWVRMKFSQYLVYTERSSKLRADYFRYAIPIIPAAASWWIMTMADRWMIAAFLGVTMNGIYAIAVKIPAILLMINTVFSLAWKDSAILNYHTDDKNDYYSFIFKHYYRLLATTVICLTLLAKPLLAIFIDAAYFEAWKYSGILLIATLFHSLSLFWSAGFHGAKNTKALLSTTIIGALLNVILNLILIPFIGLYAVALSTLVSFLVTWALRIKASRSFFHIQVDWKDVVVLTGMMLVAILIPFIFNGWGLVIGIGVSGILFLVYNFGLLKGVGMEVRGKISPVNVKKKYK